MSEPSCVACGAEPEPQGRSLSVEMDGAFATLQSLRQNLHLLRRSEPEQVVALEVCPGLFVQVDAALVASHTGASR